MLDVLNLVLKTIWLLIPAYTPNNFAVLLGGGTALDLGKKFVDGRRILGEGKTVRGFVGGIAGGVLCANIQYAVEKISGIVVYTTLSYSEFFTLTFLLSFGAILGDSIGSFIKRRFGAERGAKFPVLDQLTFLIVALLVASTQESFSKIFDFQTVVTGILITPILHISTNFIAYKLKLKEVPW
jgi:CDP-2,3-bis-(O-geranylgeranyl)-sn-glycerol synthase